MRRSYFFLLIYFFQFDAIVVASSTINDYSQVRFGKKCNFKRESQVIVFCLSAWSDSLHAMFTAFFGEDFFNIEERVRIPANIN